MGSVIGIALRLKHEDAECIHGFASSYIMCCMNTDEMNDESHVVPCSGLVDS